MGSPFDVQEKGTQVDTCDLPFNEPLNRKSRLKCVLVALVAFVFAIALGYILLATIQNAAIASGAYGIVGLSLTISTMLVSTLGLSLYFIYSAVKKQFPSFRCGKNNIL